MSELYELPKGWEWKTIDDFVTIKGGKRIPKGKKLSEHKTPYPYIRVSDFNDFGSVDINNIQYVTEDIFNVIKNYTISSDNIYISIAGTIGKTGIIPTELNNANLTENAAKLVFNNHQYDKNYLLYFTNTNFFLEQIGLATKVVAMPKLALIRLKKVYIPIPPLSEQQRIVKKLDLLFGKIDKAISLHQKNIDEAEALMGSVLNEVFEELEEKYKIVAVGSVTNCIVPQRNKPKQFIGNIQWITTEDLILFKRISKSSKGLGLTMEDIAEAQSKVIPKDSVLMSCVGDLGMVSIADDNIVVNQQLHTFQCHSNLNNKYLAYSLFVKKNLMYQIANITTVAYMNKSKCNSIPLPLPPLNIQQKVAQYLDDISEKIERVKTIQKEKMANLKALKASILDKAFRGEI